MIVLTEEQQRELRNTDTPRALDPATGGTYILVQPEVFERFQFMLEDEIAVTGEMVDRLMADEDRDDPTLAYYQQQH